MRRSPGHSKHGVRCQQWVFLAGISVRSPRKLLFFIVYKNIFWIKVSGKACFLLLRKEALVAKAGDFVFKVKEDVFGIQMRLDNSDLLEVAKVSDL